MLPSHYCNVALLVFITLFTYLDGDMNMENDNNMKASDDISFTDPDIGAKTPELIRNKGYPVEIHHVVTSDGYILELHRIPYRKNERFYTKRKVAFLMHGLLMSSSEWVINFPHNSLGFMLADEGYDVWMGNFRGNTYSLNHTTLLSNDTKFFDFRLDEMALIDIPDQIDYVLKKTFSMQLVYVGFSQGTATMFAKLSEDPDFGKKIRCMVAMAPVTRVSHFKAPGGAIVKYAEVLFPILRWLTEQQSGTRNHLLPNTYKKEMKGHQFCVEGPFQEWFCAFQSYLFNGPQSDKYYNKTRKAVYISQTPAGSSADLLLQFAQSFPPVNKFQKFDYGEKENVKRYNQTTPPEYNTSRIPIPLALFSSSTDCVATQEDIDLLRKTVPNIIDDYIVDKEWGIETFNHGDFMYNYKADKFFNKRAIEILNKQSKFMV